MSWSDKPAGAPYGALELKITYQRNLLWGNAVTVLMAAAMAVLYLLGQSAIEIVPPSRPIIGDREVHIEIAPNPPTIKYGHRPPIPTPPRERSAVIPVPPIPIPDSLFSGDENNTISSQKEISEFNGALNPGPPGDGTEFAYNFSDTTEDWPDVEDFVVCERYPEMISAAQPEYPRIAKTTQTEGEVTVQVLVDEKGEPLDVRVYKDSGRNVGFEEAAVKAAWNCRFSPGIQNGRPVKVWVVFKIEFTLENNY